MYRSTNTPPDLDGQLSKDEWKDASFIYNFTQKEPEEGEVASERTFVLITYDERNVYFGIRCYDKQPKKIVATEMRRDSNLSDNDYVEIIIDTFHDQRNAYYFATNSLGARLDSEIKTEGTHINWDWDGVWFCNASRDKLGWTAEVAIPFETLRFKSKDDLTWGINFGRYIPRKREESYWSPISRDDDFDNFGKFKASKFGVMRGLRNVTHDNRIRVKPYTIAGVETNFSGTNSTEKLADIGLDAKVNLTSNLTSDITINTDFAQVEADQEQVNLSRFNLFFPEKRDFFLEGLDIFNIGEESAGEPFTLLFFSRQIGLHRDSTTFEFKEVPITGGVKVTGKEGPYELGFLNVFTEDLEYTNMFNQTTHIPKTNYSALRVKRDIFKRSHVGFMGLSKDPVDGGNYNRTFAVDGLFSFDNNITVKGYLAKTFTPGLEGKDYNGFFDFSWGNDLVYTRASYTDIGENFNPEMGFLQWTDIRKYNMQFSVSPRPDFLSLKQSHFSYDLNYITDHNNELQYRTIQTGLFNVFRDDSFLFLGLLNVYDNLPDGFYLENTFVEPGIYNYNIFGLSYTSDLSRKISGALDVAAGTFYDGTLYGVTLTNYLKPNDKFSVDLTYDWNRVEVPFDNGEFTTSILGTRFSYSFSPNLFTKAYIQWNHFDKRIVSNFLVNFIHSPGSDFYLVYNEEWDTSDGFSTSNRTVLAKLTHLINL
ncbi:carbohydrate binding family 9 domain-containing protein [candidate division KSB1 bacterium]|nr:carbohydrate binding family 9 domain-containing protein [candidate division KSB1 bacterium]NIR71440.1 carbohydrate binding family 9 domain-containing protein [candidate division KSB1 bacterium]NIS23361.1 carbohydrate binding family 9 domain-containing protein [candidate division KSB1 bacterium]NIT70252.1 carbohydrate binding family 9 domain-containing protein [candidate division KSB1 bacterium]NIU23975.1 carbohydrate binding family 9 domain-containing protein [candidate division KSB1 bacteri